MPYQNPGQPPYLNALANVYNRTPANLRKTRAAIARVRSGKGRGRFIFSGDSLTAGAGAGTSNSGSQYYITGASPLSQPDQFAAALTGMGIPASRNSWAGSKSLASTALMSAYDSRLTFGASWSGGVSTLGGVGLASAGSDAASFAPVGNVDTGIILSKQHAGDGAMSALVDGSTTASATITGSNATDGFIRTTVALGSPGTHTLAVQRASGGYTTVFGMILQNSTVPAIDVINAGAIGSTSAFHTIATSGAWATEAAFAAWQPDTVFLKIGTNDLGQGVDPSVTLGNIQKLITAAQNAGADVVLEFPTYALSGYGTANQRETLREGLIALGFANGCMVVDYAGRFGTAAAGNADGYYCPDGLHLNGIGYAEQVQALASAIMF